MAALLALVEDGLALVGGAQLHRVVLQLGVAALGAGLLRDGARRLPCVPASAAARPCCTLCSLPAEVTTISSKTRDGTDVLHSRHTTSVLLCVGSSMIAPHDGQKTQRDD